MRRLFLIFMILFLITACTPKFEEDEVVQENNDVKEKAFIPYNISDKYYRTVLPFKEGKARGLITGTVHSRLDMAEIETGLMRIASEHFSTEDYLFQEGQYLSSDTVLNWLERKEKDKEGTVENKGLNPPPAEGEANLAEENRKTPKYLSHVLEHNYLQKNEQGNVELGGVVIGLSLNTVHYYRLPELGYPREYKLDMEVVEQKGKKYAQEVLNRLRQKEELKEIPIVIALFKEEPHESIVPGNYYLKTYVEHGETTIKKWQSIQEDYVLFPSEKATDNYYKDATKMANFKSDIDNYFSNYVGVIGRGFYKDEQLQELTIEIPIQFFGKAEVIGFTEYVTGRIMDHFPPYITIQVYISSMDQPESLIYREANSEEPFVHIYR